MPASTVSLEIWRRTRARRILWLALAMPPLAFADLPFTAASLGTVDATADFCGRVGTAAAMDYQDQARRAVREVPEQEVESARQTADYKAAFARTRDELSRAGERAAGRVCAAAPAWDFKSASKPATKPRAKVSPYRAAGITAGAKTYYQSVWGVDNLLVRITASGDLVRFSYRVVDPARAEALNDERATPQLIDPKHGLALQIPSLENVGLLRQKGTPVAGKEYSMVFSNKGFPVKSGDRVNVVIGNFRADGLIVE